MAGILTESFCERCGTRYTFEATTPRRLGLGRIRTLSRGVKNFVANDNASFSEAMATAREDGTRSASLQQLDAFHRAFNFCMSCRQYTCRNCWNSNAGECLSCAPDFGVEVLPGESSDMAVVADAALASTPPESAHPNVAASAWPTADLHVVPEAPAPAGLPAAELITATEIEVTAPATDIELTPEELAAIESALARHVGPPDGGPAATPAKDDTPAGLAVAEIPKAPVNAAATPELPGGTPAPVAAARVETRRLLQRFRPRRDRPAPVAEPVVSVERVVSERIAAAVAAEAVAVIAAEPVAVIAGEAKPSEGAVKPAAVKPAAVKPAVAKPAAKPAAVKPAVAKPAVRPVVAELTVGASSAIESRPAERAAQPVVAKSAVAAVKVPARVPGPPSPTTEPAAAEPPAEPSPGVVPAPPRADVKVQPTWSVVAPDGASPGQPKPAPPAWATPGSTTRREADAMPSATWAARVATARPLESPVWAASSRDILAAGPPGAAGPVGIQSCVSCGLSLSANARFCRRCGTRQG